MRRGDDTQAFGGSFLLINLTNETGMPVKKAVWKSGSVIKTFLDPIFPLEVNLTSSESKKLDSTNICYLAVWDDQGRKKTCIGQFKFTTEPEVVNDGHCC